MNMRYFNLLLFMVLIFCPAPASAENLIHLYYEERAPYAVTDSQGEVSGLTATPAATAFKQANIPFKWKKMPFKRQLETIKYNKKRACGIGWFKKPEREEFANFTDVIYQDKPAITISLKGNSALKQHRDVRALLKDKQIKLLIKDSFSYGAYIDEQIKNYAPETIVVVNSTNVQMLQMILAGRADYFFVSEEEAEQIILNAGYEMSKFQLRHYSDMPAGNRRYMGCSRQVSQETIELLNHGLK